MPNSKEKVPRISRHENRILEKTTQGAPKIDPEAPKSVLVLPKSTLGLLKFDLGTKIMPFFVSDALLGHLSKGSNSQVKSGPPFLRPPLQ